MNLELDERELRVLKACLNEGTRLMHRLIGHQDLKPETNERLKKDLLVIACILNKVKILAIKHKLN